MKKIIKISYILDDNEIKQIKKQLVDKDLSQSQLANNLGVSKAYINAIINGKKIITKRTIKILENQGIKIGGEYE